MRSGVGNRRDAPQEYPRPHPKFSACCRCLSSLVFRHPHLNATLMPVSPKIGLGKAKFLGIFLSHTASSLYQPHSMPEAPM